MPSDRPAPAPRPEEIEALLDRVLEDLKTPADPRRLNDLRAAFRRKVPFHLRAYAAALLLDRCLGTRSRDAGRGERRREGARESREERLGKTEGQRSKSERSKSERSKSERPRDESSEAKRGSGKAKAEPKAVESAPAREMPRPRLEGEAATLFFGMGKRQRLYSRIVIKLLMDEAGLAETEIGEIRTFDNYAFADVAASRADEAIAALAEVEWKGRPLPVNRAKKRGAEEAPEEALSRELPEEGDALGPDLETEEDSTEE